MPALRLALDCPDRKSVSLPKLQKQELEDTQMSMAIFEKMGLEEHVELNKCEKVIRDGKDTFVKVGIALETIRDNRLYRANHATFEEYCQKKWGFSRQYAYDLVKGAVAVKALPKDLSTIVDKPGAATALARVPEKDRAEVVSEIKKSGKPATAKAIKEKAAEVAKPAPEKPAIKLDAKDDLGVIIPAALVPLWERRMEAKALLDSMREIRRKVEKAMEENDPLFMELSNVALADFKMVESHLKMAIPYTVCLPCGGRLKSSCQTCHGRGFLSKDRYQTVPEELRKMREKAASK